MISTFHIFLVVLIVFLVSSPSSSEDVCIDLYGDNMPTYYNPLLLDSSTGLYYQQPSQCWWPFVVFDGRCYVSSMTNWTETTSLAWSDAQDVCIKYGSNLVSIFTLRENCFVWGSIPGSNNNESCIAENGALYANPFNGTRYNCYAAGFEVGTTYIGLNQAVGSTGAEVQWAEGAGAKFDPVPIRSGGASPFGGDDTCCVPYFNFTSFVYNFVYVDGSPSYADRPSWDNCPWAVWFGEPAEYSSYYYGTCEPNNFGVTKTEDCIMMYSRLNNHAEWNDQDCSLLLPYVCSLSAYCEPGFYLTQPYVPMPVRVNETLDALLINSTGINSTLYNMGVCTQCSAGTYHKQDGTLSIDAQCSQCPAGVYGLNGATNASCSGVCPAGYYCPIQTSLQGILPCPAGTYNPYPGQTNLTSCLTVPGGYYSKSAASSYLGTPCNAGTCGSAGATSAVCQALCPAGYYCPPASACLSTPPPPNPPQPCGSSMLYSGLGQSTCSTVQPGYYTIGPSSATRTQQVNCTTGDYCFGDGNATPCNNGTYNSLTGSSSPSACINCQAGYYCPAGSSSPTQEVCGLGTLPNPPQMYYCPAGTTARLLVDAGYYTTPTDDAYANRQGELSCGSLYVCNLGFSFPKVTWSDDACDDLSVNENLLQPNVGRQLNVSIYYTLNPNDFIVSYSLLYWGLSPSFAATAPSTCDPNNATGQWYFNPYFNASMPVANNGIFDVDEESGNIQVTRYSYPIWLDYETCRIPDIQYELVVQFNATDSEASTILTCNITLTVNDQNDRPVWPPEDPGGAISYRAIVQETPVNTAIVPCDDTLYGAPGPLYNTSYFGCPIVGSNVDLVAYDEDFNSVIRYTIVQLAYGNIIYTVANYMFRIDSCTGLITMAFDDAISYYDLEPLDDNGARFFNLTVNVTDDGNGGLFPPLSALHTVLIYVINTPEPPTLPDPTITYLTIQELQPAGTLVEGSFNASCPDPDLTITYALLIPSGQQPGTFPFTMNSSTDASLQTTPTGASTIRYESSTKIYYVTIQATTAGGITTQTYPIYVADANNPPVFTNLVDYFFIQAFSPDGTSVCGVISGTCNANTAPVTTSTVESPLNYSAIVYTLINPGFQGIFEINYDTGQIYTAPGAQEVLVYNNDTYLDESPGNAVGTGRVIYVVVEATSIGIYPLLNASSTQEFAIYIADVNTPPYFLQQNYSFYVLDSSPVNSLVIGDSAITALDPHNNITYQIYPNLMPQQSLTYSRSANSPTTPSNDGGVLFNIQQGTSSIYLAQSITWQTTPTSSCPDGDPSDRCYQIWVHVQDNGKPSEGADVFVSIMVIEVNKAPFWPTTGTTLSVYESVPQESVYVINTVNLNATDVDSPILNYTVNGGTGTTQFAIVSYGTYFNVEKQAGVKLVFQQAITQWSLFVLATDEGGSSSIGTGCAFINHVGTGCGAGTVCQAWLTTYRCFELCLPWLNGTQTTVYTDTFFCDYQGLPVSGQPTEMTTSTSFVVTINVLDDNKPPEIVGDSGVPGVVPNCNKSGSIVQGEQLDDQVAISALQVVDPDLYLNNAPFTFMPYSDEDPFWEIFTINNATGAIDYIANGSDYLQLGESFQAWVNVTDAPTPVSHTGPITTQCNVFILVVEQNTPPIFPTPPIHAVPELTGPGYIVYGALIPNYTVANYSAIEPDVLATPPDYVVFSMTYSSYFTLDSTTSQLITGGTPLVYNNFYSTNFQTTLVVQVTNSHGSSALTTVTINITEVNQPPYFTVNQIDTITFPEQAPPGTPVGPDFSTLATDPNIYSVNPLWRTPVYSIVPGTGCDSTCHFYFPPGSTVMAVMNGTDGDYGSGSYSDTAHNSWTFQVIVQDGTLNPNFTNPSALYVTITLSAVPQPPTLTSNPVLKLVENSIVNTALSFFATDNDYLTNFATLTYQITGGNTLTTFIINGGYLQLAAGQTLDYEKTQWFNLSLHVTSPYLLEASGNFSINVTNVNDVSIISAQILNLQPTLFCNGTSQVVRFYGTNLGMYYGTPAAQVYLSFIRPVGLNQVASPVTWSPSCNVSTANSAIDCSIVGHVGLNLIFTVWINVPGTQISNNSFVYYSNLAFQAPTITSITYANDLQTSGGNTIIVVGTCFGITTDLLSFNGIDSYVRYSVGSLGSPSEWPLLTYGACNSSVSSTSSITCTNATLAGTGSGLQWQVYVAEQPSNVLTYGSYAAPVVYNSSLTLLNTDGSTVSGNSIVLNGSNFGNLGSSPDYVTLTYLTYSYPFTSCTVTTAFVQVTCTKASAGVGANLTLTISFGGQASLFSSFPTFSYVGPILSTLGGTGANGGNTAGGQLVTLTGLNFGPACGVAGSLGYGINCPYVNASYTKNSTSISTGLKIVYIPPVCAVVSQTMVTCSMAAGTGAGHVWSLTIGGQKCPVNPSLATTSYGSPVVGLYSGPGADLAVTQGGQYIFISGSNFGPIGGALVTAQYGNRDIDQFEFTALNCVVATANINISCITNQGAGNDLTWTVTVDGQLGNTELTAYGAPELLFINESQPMSTEGGEVFNISGENFGAASSTFLQAVYYGPESLSQAYSPNCTVLNFQTMTCVSLPGTGTDLYWSANVQGQTSSLSDFTTSYILPDVSGNLTGTSDTSGGNLLRVAGEGYARCDPHTTKEVLWTPSDTLIQVVLDVSTVYDGNGNKNFICPGDQGVPLSELEFASPAMITSRTAYVGVRLASSLLGTTIDSIYHLTFHYEDPVLNTIFAQSNAAYPGYTFVTMIGNNFCSSETCCQTYFQGGALNQLASITVVGEGVVTHTDTQIVIKVIGTGAVFVQCSCSADPSTDYCPLGYLVTEAISYSSNSPFILGAQSVSGVGLQVTPSTWNTQGNETLQIWGLYFGTDVANFPNVTVNGTSWTVTSYSVVSCQSPDMPQSMVTYIFAPNDVCYLVLVTTPPGTGLDLPIVVAQGVLASVPVQAWEFFSYSFPNVDIATFPSLGLQLCSGSQDSYTMTGTDFGSVEGQLYFGSLLATVTDWSDTSITFYVPPGEGLGLPMQVVQNLVPQASTPVVSGIVLNYDPPSIVSISQYLLLTQGGQLFEMTGLNFGRPYPGNGSAYSPTGPSITIDLEPCIIVNNTDTVAWCLTPAGEGTDLPVGIDVATQPATAAQVVAYAPPVVYSVYPQFDLPTSGSYINSSNESTPLTMTIIGENFGVNRLSLSIGQLTSFYTRLFSATENYDQFLVGTNHTHIVVNVPPYFGDIRNLTVSVGGGSETLQISNSDVFISYAPPEVNDMMVINVDGSLSAPFNASDGVVLPLEAFNTSLPLGVDDFTGSRRRLDITTSYGFWQTQNSTVTCQSNILYGNLFWETSYLIAPNGQYVQTVSHFDQGSGVCLPSELTETVVISGTLTDLGPSPLLWCGGRLYSNEIDTIIVTPLAESILSLLNSGCPCNGAVWAIGSGIDIGPCLARSGNCDYFSGLYYPPSTRYGSYVISNSDDLYLTGTADTIADHTSALFVILPDYATASVLASLDLNQPTGPTDGCYQWEDLSTYLQRATQISQQESIPVSSVPRLCLNLALIQMDGSNFGSDVLGIADALRVFLIDTETGQTFEASTTTNSGLQTEVCPTPTCVHTDDLVRFWIPPGMGTNLLIQILVGNQYVNATVRFSYSPPSISTVNPGSVGDYLPFQDADGDSLIISGTNFGGIPTNSSVLMNGRPCLASTWNSGAQSDPQGRAFLTCNAQLDVVGPRSVVVCVANQVFVYPIDRADGDVLIAGDAVGAWTPGTNGAALGYNQQLQSVSLAWCDNGQVGKLYELCHACPSGAICDNGTYFSDPLSSPDFFATTYSVFNADGTLNDLATSNCAEEAWNTSYQALYPNLIQRPTCAAYLACQPASSCLGNNTCAVGYEYTMYACLTTRAGYMPDGAGYDNATDYLSLSMEQVNGTLNSCRVYRDPYTYDWQGTDADCMGATPALQTCVATSPQECSSCQVLVDGNNTRFGVCACSEPPLCALCTIHLYYLLNNLCQPCPANPGLLIGMLFLLAFAVVGAGYYLAKKNINLAFLTIGIDYFQVLAIFSTTQVTWPPIILAIFNAMAIFNFNIDITAPQCLTPNLSFAVTWWIQELLPMAVLGILFAIHVIYSIMKFQKWGDKAKYTTHISSLIAIFVISMYFMYLMITKEALDIFDCNPIINPLTNLPTDQYTYTTFTDLSCDGGGRCICGEPGGLQQQLVPFAIIFLVIYTFGFPAFVFYILHKNAQIVIEDQYLRARGVGNRRETNPDCYDIRKRYARVYYQFKPRFAPYWILVLITRKFWVAFAALMFRGSPAFQLAVILLVLFAGIVLQVLWRPFLSTGEYPMIVKELDAMAERSISEPQFAVYREIQTRVEMAVRLDVKFQRKRRQQRAGRAFLAAGGKEVAVAGPLPSRSKSARVAAARYFADLNTLEFFLLGAGILICLSGIMFQAAVEDTRAIIQEQADVVTILIVVVIIASFVYYFLFFMAEVAPELISACFEFLRRSKKDKASAEEDYDDQNINLQENPMFAAPKVVFADNRALESEIAASLALLQQAEQQNKALRDELKNKKVAAQLEETRKQKNTEVESSQGVRRKEFAQTRLTNVLTGPTRQRAVKKSSEEDKKGDDDYFDEDDD